MPAGMCVKLITTPEGRVIAVSLRPAAFTLPAKNWQIKNPTTQVRLAIFIFPSGIYRNYHIFIRMGLHDAKKIRLMPLTPGSDHCGGSVHEHLSNTIRGREDEEDRALGIRTILC